MALTQAFVSGVSSPAAETAIATTPALGVVAPATATGVIIRGSLNVTAGTSATAVVIRCRAGAGTGGPLIGAALTHTLAAGNSASIPYDFVDSNFTDPGQSYTITVAQTSASVAGTVNQAEVEIDLAVP